MDGRLEHDWRPADPGPDGIHLTADSTPTPREALRTSYSVVASCSTYVGGCDPGGGRRHAPPARHRRIQPRRLGPRRRPRSGGARAFAAILCPAPVRSAPAAARHAGSPPELPRLPPRLPPASSGPGRSHRAPSGPPRTFRPTGPADPAGHRRGGLVDSTAAATTASSPPTPPGENRVVRYGRDDAEDTEASAKAPVAGTDPCRLARDRSPSASRARSRWAQLLAQVYDIDPLRCPGGHRREALVMGRCASSPS